MYQGYFKIRDQRYWDPREIPNGNDGVCYAQSTDFVKLVYPHKENARNCYKIGHPARDCTKANVWQCGQEGHKNENFPGCSI